MYKKIHKNNVVAGLTGGIASGKSTVAGFFKELGAKIIDADAIAREIVKPQKPAWQEIVTRFGKEILLPNQQIDRKKLAEIIFGDKSAKAVLDAITHPIILAEMQRKTYDLAKKSPGLILWDVPLLFEAGFNEYVDISILVYVSPQTQLQRLMQRDGISCAEARLRIDSQMPLQQKKELAPMIMDNSGNMEEVKAKVSLMYHELINNLKDCENV